MFHQNRLFFLVVFVGLPVAPLPAAAAPFYWAFINVVIDVQENGDMLVTESHKYVFTGPLTNERYRWIPLDHINAIEGVSVTENGVPRSVTTGIENGQFWIRWRHPLDPPEERTFTLSYRVKGGLRIGWFSDEVYWKAIFAKRAAPIDAAEVLVRWPEVLEEPIEHFSVAPSGMAEAELVDSRTVRFISIDRLLPGQELEVRVRVPHRFLDASPQVAGILIVSACVLLAGVVILKARS